MLLGICSWLLQIHSSLIPILLCGPERWYEWFQNAALVLASCQVCIE